LRVDVPVSSADERPVERGAKASRRTLALVLGGALLMAGVVVGVRWRAHVSTVRAPGPWASTLVALSGSLGNRPDELSRGWAALEHLADEARRRHETQHEPWADSLVHEIFEDAHIEREIHENEPRFYRLPDVLEHRRGNCVGLVGLYLALAERVGLSVDAVRVPGHVFVRTRETPPRNLEMLRRGEAMSDAWYRQRYGPWPTDDGYDRPLALAEIEALYWYDAGGYHLAAGRLSEAASSFQRASQRAPQFAEAAASWMSARQLLAGSAEAASFPGGPGAPPLSPSFIDPHAPNLAPSGALPQQEHRP